MVTQGRTLEVLPAVIWLESISCRAIPTFLGRPTVLFLSDFLMIYGDIKKALDPP
jgi:hypothetical protein